FCTSTAISSQSPTRAVPAKSRLSVVVTSAVGGLGGERHRVAQGDVRQRGEDAAADRAPGVAVLGLGSQAQDEVLARPTVVDGADQLEHRARAEPRAEAGGERGGGRSAGAGGAPPLGPRHGPARRATIGATASTPWSSTT